MRSVIVLLILLLSGCSIQCSIDEHGARIGKEQITETEQGDISIYQLKFTGVGIFW